MGDLIQGGGVMIKKTEPRLSGGARHRMSVSLKSKAAVAAVTVFSFLMAFTSPSAAVDFEAGPSRLAIHGFLSQAYGNSTGGQIIGIPTEGTSDYRNAALQFRYAYSSKDAFVLQLSHTRFGLSGLQSEIPEVQLNWVFYQKEFFDTTSVKIGKFPVPLGIYNETLHVGTVLPFYRAPFMIYGDGAFTSETINGVGVYHTFGLGRDWSLETDLYVGEWVYLQQIVGVITSTLSKDIVGTQVWLQTPLEGLRFGVSANRRTDQLPPPAAPDTQETVKSTHASIDANFERFFFQTEYRRDDQPSQHYHSYYGMAGIKLLEGKLGVNVMAEYAHLTIPGFVSDLKLSKNYAAGLRYAFRPDLIAKAEYHQMKTYVAEDPVIPFFLDPIDVKYYIVSLAVSF
jgi:hypothetical protein